MLSQGMGEESRVTREHHLRRGEKQVFPWEKQRKWVKKRPPEKQKNKKAELQRRFHVLLNHGLSLGPQNLGDFPVLCGVLGKQGAVFCFFVLVAVKPSSS